MQLSSFSMVSPIFINFFTQVFLRCLMDMKGLTLIAQMCTVQSKWNLFFQVLKFFTGVNLVVLNHWTVGKEGSLPHFKEGSEKKNEPNTPEAVEKYQRLVNGYLSSVFLRFCHFSKSTLEVNCVLAIDVRVQFYPQTLQLSKLIPNRSELPNRNSFTRKGLFHAGEMGYRFPGFTEYSAPEIFNWPCNLVLFYCGKQERSIHYSCSVKLFALPRG